MTRIPMTVEDLLDARTAQVAHLRSLPADSPAAELALHNLGLDWIRHGGPVDLFENRAALTRALREPVIVAPTLAGAR